MFNFNSGIPIARVFGGKDNGKLLYISSEEQKIKKGKDSDSYFDSSSESSSESESSDENFKEYEIENGRLEPRLDINERSVSYIAGPSGSGKTSYAVNIIKPYLKFFPEKPFYLFSRTESQNDPAFRGMSPIQVPINDELLKNPIDITKELVGGSILLFDDVNTIQNDKLKKNIDKLIADILEIGRKLNITIIITNHLVIPNEKKVARTILNEMQALTIFPKSGSSQQIRYSLKTYFGLSNKQIDDLLKIDSRWITISKKYPMYVMHEHGCFIL